MSGEKAITGGCHCGAVRYSFTGKMMWPGNCHCSVCRRFSGGKGGSWFGVMADGLTVDGEVAYHEYRADSGNTIRRGRCAVCGAPVCNRNSAMPDVVVIAAGSLDDPGVFAPRMEIYAGSAPPWDRLDGGLPHFDGMPVPGGG